MAKLKYKVAKLEDVEEALRPMYAARDGAFFLDADGVAEKAKLDEFRDNNIALKQQIEDLNKKFDGIDLDHVRNLLKAEQGAKDKKLIDAGKVDELVEQRVAAMRTEYEAKLKASNESSAKLGAQLEGLVIDNALQSEAVKMGVRETAMEDVLLRGRSRFKLKEGKATPVGPDGKVVYGKDGSTPESMNEWLSGLATSAAHLFKPSTGSGAENRGAGGGTAKTMKRSDFNALDATQQHAFVIKDKGVIVD